MVTSRRGKKSSGWIPPDKRQVSLVHVHEEAPYGLTQRQMTVLGKLVEGKTDKEIAWQMDVTPFTVNKHVGAILSKMGELSRTGAAVRAIKEHLVEY